MKPLHFVSVLAASVPSLSLMPAEESVGLRSADLPSSRLITYPAPEGVALNADFSVKVRLPGGQWEAVPSYLVTVNRVNATGHEPLPSSMGIFDFAGEVEVAVTYRRGRIDSARVRPLFYGIVPDIAGDTLTFSLDRPRNLSVEVNGDIFGNLQLFANPVETSRPDPNDPNVIYFGRGLHEIETPPDQIAPPPPTPNPDAGQASPPPSDPVVAETRRQRRANARESARRTMRVPSGKTVYIAGGAVVRGRIVCDDVHDVRIIGRGIVAQNAWGGGISIANSEDVEVSGVFAPKCFTGGSRRVKIENVKCISFLGNGDGMNVVSSEDVMIDGVFSRNSDDCITVYGTRGGFTGGASRITVRNSTLWADVAHPIFVGTHGNTPNPETLEDLRFLNLDILDHCESQIDYQGCLALNAGDSNLIRNVRFENIRIEDFRRGQLVNLRVFYNRKYCTSPGRGIEDVLFKDVTYTGNNAEQSIIAGYDEARKVRNIVFENLRINGVLITDDETPKPFWFKTADVARIFVGEHVDGITFSTTAARQQQ